MDFFARKAGFFILWLFCDKIFRFSGITAARQTAKCLPPGSEAGKAPESRPGTIAPP